MSDSDEDNVIRYGTPLEPFDEEEVPSKKKFQPKTTDQYAVDEHGRRRFHGAFTGGFSAGHGNTVGTPDGFTPATFKSSRRDKALSSKSQRPEDFMDEEDRSEFGIAPRLMQTHSDFSGQKRPHQQRFHDGPIPGEPVLEQVLQTVHETAAVRILKAQGWRPGQGAGVRLTAGDKAKRKVYGCFIPGQSTEPAAADSDSDSSVDYDTLYAPDDYEPCASRVKSDRFGLGYRGLSRRAVLGGPGGAGGEEWGEGARSHLKMTDKGRKVSIRGQAFGVGALEEDDEDIYASEDMSHYDFTLGAERREETKKRAQESGVLPGFMKATKRLPPAAAAYPPPALPRDYAPCVAGARRSRFQATDATPRDQGLGRHELTAQARGALLGETPLPKPNEPNQPIEPTDPIAKLLGRNVNFVSTNIVDTTNKESTEKGIDYIPISITNEPAVKVFKPFASNPAKQLRYEKYVQNGVVEEDGDTGRLAAWERDREMMEFEQAAKLYRPLSGIMGDRFTHATQPDERPTDPLAAVARSAGAGDSPAAAAAAAGQYGAGTRRAEPWRPAALVCKRFNVPDPNAARPEQQKEDRPNVSYSIFSYLETSVHDKESFTKEQAKFSGSKSVADPKPAPSTSKIDEQAPKKDVELSTEAKDANVNKRLTVAELFMRESEKDLKESQSKSVTETIEKFDKMELYKAIFLSDSEEEEPAKTEEIPKVATDYNEFTEVPKNIERNRSPPRGIFANIDFDELNSWKRTEPKEVDTIPDVKPVDEASLYGPKIPESINKRLQETTDNKQAIDKSDFRPAFRSKSDREKAIEIVDSSSSEDSWVEAKDKSKKKKKKSKKSKSKHKKSKHKKKDR